jgi:hypothetical protein
MSRPQHDSREARRPVVDVVGTYQRQSDNNSHRRPAPGPAHIVLTDGTSLRLAEAIAGTGVIPVTWINRRSADRGQGDNLSAGKEINCPPTGKSRCPLTPAAAQGRLHRPARLAPSASGRALSTAGRSGLHPTPEI